LSDLGQQWADEQRGKQEDAGAQVDKAEELRVKWGVESGQLWQLGDHRLICGDCTDKATVERVMQGERSALLVTSPPYGVGKEYETGDLDDWRTTIHGMLQSANVEAAFIDLADVKCTPDKRERHTYGELIALCEKSGLPLVATRMWVKSPAWAQGPYWLSSFRPVDDFEYLGLFGTLEHKDRIKADWKYRGVWEFPSVASNAIHSAAFPIELPERAITLLTDEGATIYEPFCGSGTTIIACERLGRKCRAVEISPAYCAVAIERWAQTTGGTPILANGA
jgi:DNA modification methylase